MKTKFELVTDKISSGDQPKAINDLVKGIKNNKKAQVLLGATGTGKTFTIANVINKVQKKTLVMVHNKTLAGQLYQELKALFPNNHVEYFISYFDFYQPEAYLPSSDTYIEKSSKSNEEIAMMRLSTLNALANYDDVIVVASVAAIYASVSKSNFKKFQALLKVGDDFGLDKLKANLVNLKYHFNNIDLKPGTFRVNGDVVEIALGYTDEYIIRVSFFGDEIEKITKVDPLTGKTIEKIQAIAIAPAEEYIADIKNDDDAFKALEQELNERIKYFKQHDQLIEAQRIEQRTKYDIDAIKEFGYCSGIENYARYFENRQPGETPYTILDFFGDDWLFIVDESHISLPQFRGMYETDKSRKTTLVEYGFRLPSALDNRPLKFDEIQQKIDKAIYVSATPNEWELNAANNEVVEQIVRPTFLLDPIIIIKPTKNQIDDLINDLHLQRQKNERTFISVMTIRMAEELTSLLKLRNIKVAYLHNELKTLERSKIINDLRRGKYEAVVGINLLREGIDAPEVSLVSIFDADKPGLFRNEKSLIQMIGRAARNVDGKVVLYADKITDDMQKAIDETNRRRQIQLAYNKQHNIIPKTIIKPIYEDLAFYNNEEDKKSKKPLSINQLKKEMLKAAKEQNYELAAKIRDQIIELSELKSNN